MYLHGLGVATPRNAFRQSEIWECFQREERFHELTGRSQGLLEKLLTGDNGIEERRIVMNEPGELFRLDAEGLNRKYEAEAPALATEGVLRALEQAGVRVAEVDALFVCTCTGYLCPGLSSYVAEELELRSDAFLQDAMGFGCGAAIPMWRVADGFLAANPGATVVTVAVELCSLAFYLNNEPGVLISACLFGDAAAASVWKGTNGKGEMRIGGFRTVHQPENRERIRFVNEGGYLKNQLDRRVPELAGQAVGRLWESRLAEPCRVISHSGGRDVIESVEKELKVSLGETREVMRKYGNCSSPSVVMGLEERVRSGGEDERLWLTSFGAGFSAHSCELWREN